ncbi:hypothetical protein GH714_029848 [Hevea brasiliensis]|uniref:Uncharacterized protein n=1 Tax=Hevea brasiliensis TaxID=3981 RepID=A0A6A6KZN7_HEVBR|nr:hypothetical protein GH714_029848 [Hevea brasiliensis]
MHRKFRQNSSEPLKDFAIGQPSLDDQQHYTKPNYATRSFKQAHKDHLRKSFAGLEAARIEEEEDEEEYFEEESSAAISELFHGFLAIGTLGSDPVNTNPSTPTFAISVENITEKETVTENELKLINDELEKVLGAEAREDYCNDSSGRNSYVSAGRSSHGSTITLSGKPMEGQETNVNGTTVCPLQGYLFGSAIELSENNGCGKEGAQDITWSSTAAAAGTVDPASAETKLQKIIHMFHRKVHPENSTSARKADKPQKNENKKTTNNGGHNNGNQMLLDEENSTSSESPFKAEHKALRESI